MNDQIEAMRLEQCTDLHIFLCPELIETCDRLQVRDAGKPERAEELKVDLGFVEQGRALGKADPTIAEKKLVDLLPRIANAVSDAGFKCRNGKAAVWLSKDDGIYIRLSEKADWIINHAFAFHDLIHRAAAPDCSSSISAAHEADFDRGKMLFQPASDRQCKNDIPDVVVTAYQDMRTLYCHCCYFRLIETGL
jgi:hypothetical protein